MFHAAILPFFLLSPFLHGIYGSPLPSLSSNGPVITTNFMDPSVIELNGGYYAFGGANGNPAGINVQVAFSPNFSTWTVQSGYDALPEPGPWAASPAHLWSPDINQLDDGSFILYYAATYAASPAQHCIGAAVSKTILGPYSPYSEPIFCPLSGGGAIDPDGYKDPVSGKRYIVYKVDGNSIGNGGACSNSADPIIPTPIMLQNVASDGVTLIGGPVQLITNDAIDGPSVEAPALLYGAAQKIYFLLYSSGCFTSTSYAVRVASATSLTGPWTKASAPFLVTGQTAADVYIPGGVDVTADSSKLVFHGDLNLGWFTGNGPRVRGMYAAQAVTYANEAWVGSLLSHPQLIASLSALAWVSLNSLN